MGMFDHYIPDPPVKCPKCGKEISGWQGKNDPAPALLVWKQGVAAPIDQRVDDEWRGDPKVLQGLRLPEGEIWIYGGQCACGYFAEGDFRGFVRGGVWETLDTSFEAARQHRLRRIEMGGVRRS
jgi:hypothetical protein